MAKFKQDYSLTGFKSFVASYADFGMPAVSEHYMASNQFLDLMYATIKNVTSDKYTFLRGPNETYSICVDNKVLAKIRKGKLIKLLLPGIVKQDANTAFLQGMGVEYVVDAAFPDLIHGGSNFMKYAYDLKHLYVPKMVDTGKDSLFYSQIERVDMPATKKLGKNTLYDNEKCTVFNAKNLRELADNVMFANMVLDDEKVDASKLVKAGRGCSFAFYAVRDRNLAKQH